MLTQTTGVSSDTSQTLSAFLNEIPMNHRFLVQNTMHLDKCKSSFPVQMFNVPCHSEFCNAPAGLMLHHHDKTQVLCAYYLIYSFFLILLMTSASFFILPTSSLLPHHVKLRQPEGEKRQQWISPSSCVHTSSIKQFWEWLCAHISLPVSHWHGWLVATCNQPAARMCRGWVNSLWVLRHTGACVLH